jgi:hypothetical protein
MTGIITPAYPVSKRTGSDGSPAVNTVAGLAWIMISLVARSAVVLVLGSALMSPAPMI